MAEGCAKELTRIGLGFNPSIVEDYVLVRTSNYELDVPPGPSWEPDTVNYLGRLRDRKVENLNPLEDSHRSRIVMRNGLEDGRLIRYHGRLYGLFSALYQTTGAVVVTRNTMTLVDLESFEYRTFPGNIREKNWMPFEFEDELWFLTSTSPFKAFSVSGKVKEGPGLETFWSGSSQLIPFRDGWLGVVHRHGKKVKPSGSWVCRDYIHAFIFMDKHFNLDLSPPFRFFGEGVEFCAGLKIDGDELCLSFGVHDNAGYLLWLGLNNASGNGPADAQKLSAVKNE